MLEQRQFGNSVVVVDLFLFFFFNSIGWRNWTHVLLLLLLLMVAGVWIGSQNCFQKIVESSRSFHCFVETGKNVKVRKCG